MRLSAMRERSVAMLLVVNGFVVLLAASLVTYGLRFCRPDRAALMLIGEIPMTYLLAWAWLKEVPGVPEIGGSVLICAATVVAGGGFVTAV